MFDGEDVEQFCAFEQNLLMRVINNETVNWDAKFAMLLESTQGIAHDVVSAYSEVYSMNNFIQACEILYYTYAHTAKFEDALLLKLFHAEKIDIRKPNTLMAVKVLITRLLSCLLYTSPSPRDS